MLACIDSSTEFLLFSCPKALFDIHYHSDFLFLDYTALNSFIAQEVLLVTFISINHLTSSNFLEWPLHCTK